MKNTCELYFFNHISKDSDYIHSTLANFNRDSMWILIFLESMVPFILLAFVYNRKLTQFSRVVVACVLLSSIVTIFELACWLSATQVRDIGRPWQIYQTFAGQVSFINCAQWPRMMNSWVNFLIWTAAVVLALKLQISATSIELLIEKGALVSKQQKTKIQFLYLMFFLPSLLDFVYFNTITVLTNTADTKIEQ